MTSRAAVDSFLAQPALALVGMSRSGKRFGNLAYRELTAKGYRVYPIHPAADMIEGHCCYQRFVDLPEPVDAVLIVVPSAEAATMVREAAEAVGAAGCQRQSDHPVVATARPGR